MPDNSSLKTLVSTDLAPVRLDNSELAVQDDSGHYNPLDVEEYSYTNRELVNLENAAVNIENSNDVIIGPVTQFNVNGNVTIFQNGQEAIEGATIEKEDTPNNNAKLPKIEKPQDLDPKKQLKRKAIKLLFWFIFVSFLLISATISLLYIVNDDSESESKGLYIPEKPIGENTNIGTHHCITKDEWGGRPAKSKINITTPIDLVIVKHTGGSTCKSFQRCAGIIQSLQSQSVGEGLPDIYCNFIIGGDGNIYEGRGFDAQSAFDNTSYDIVFLGSYDFDEPTPASLDAAKALMKYALQMHKLSKDYKVVNHNQTYATLSPGLNIMKEVRTWPHYDPGLYFSKPLIYPEQNTSIGPRDF